MRRPAGGLLAVACAAAVAGCGAGTDTTETRAARDFTRLRADDDVRVVVRAGARPFLRVTAGENVLGDVQTRIVGDTLEVGMRDRLVIGWAADGEPTVEVGVPSLAEVTATGSSRVEISGLRSRALSARVADAARLRAVGRVGALSLEAADAGDAALAELASRSAEVRVHDAANAAVAVRDRLDAEVADAGDLRYRGRPQLRSRVQDAGHLRPW